MLDKGILAALVLDSWSGEIQLVIGLVVGHVLVIPPVSSCDEFAELTLVAGIARGTKGFCPLVRVQTSETVADVIGWRHEAELNADSGRCKEASMQEIRRGSTCPSTACSRLGQAS